MAPWKYPSSRRNRCPQMVQRSFILITPENTWPWRAKSVAQVHGALEVSLLPQEPMSADGAALLHLDHAGEHLALEALGAALARDGPQTGSRRKPDPDHALERRGEHPHEAGSEIQSMALPRIDGALPGLQEDAPASAENDPRAGSGVKGELAQVG